MSQVRIKSPNPDVIWETWKRNVKKPRKLEKHYKIKGAVFKLEDITAAEFVKEVNRAAIIYMRKDLKIKADSDKNGKVITTNSRGVEKTRFYKFESSPKKSEWKGDEEVPFYSSLKTITCSKCDGKGAHTCKKCDGSKFRDCPDCSGKKTECRFCSSGKIEITVTVINEKGDKSKEKKYVNCPDCFGSGQYECSRCGGSGKIPCTHCESSGKIVCDECRGNGVEFEYKIFPVPFKTESNTEYMLLPSYKMKDLEREIGKDLEEAIQTVEGILINNPEKELNPKYVEPNLGYIDKPISRILKDASKEVRRASKDPDLTIKTPIYLFPVLILNCETRKGRGFQVFAIGSEKKFRVYGEI